MMGLLAWAMGIALIVILLTTLLRRSTSFPSEESSQNDSENDGEANDKPADEDYENGSESPDQPREINTEEAEKAEALSDTTDTPDDIRQDVEQEKSGPTTEAEAEEFKENLLNPDTGIDLQEEQPGTQTMDEATESLPFEPIYTFEPDPEQWTTEYSDAHEKPWPKHDPEKQEEYNDLEEPTKPSINIQKAIEWLNNASTEAIHQASERKKFLGYLSEFIENPRATGAGAIQRLEWRDKNPNISRLIGDRYLLMALGLSCHDPVNMRPHLETLGECLNEPWNNDGLEHPLLYQSIGRLGILTPTSIEDIQPSLTKRVEGRIPRSNTAGVIEEAAFHSLLLSVSTGPEYPLQESDENLPRAWHWDGNNPPLATWDQLLPILYTLWIYHWSRDQSGGAVRDIGPLLGSWWEENPPSEGYFDKHPEVWEGILMFCWARAPVQSHVWEQLKNRYESLNFKDSNLDDMTDTYFEWADQYQSEGQPPDEAFNGRRMPPLNWIRPLPSDILRDYSQPSYEFEKEWCRQLTRLKKPDEDRL